MYDEGEKTTIFSSYVILCVIIEVLMSNRLKQFIIQYKYRNLSIDEEFLADYLSDLERVLFATLKIAEQNHSISVAKSILNENPIDRERELIKTGLLHDVGKSIRPLSLLEKGIYVILHKVLGENLKKLASFDGIATYLYHGERGAEILRRSMVFEDNPIFYDVIKTHHWDGKKILELKNGKKILSYHWILKEMDEKN